MSIESTTDEQRASVAVQRLVLPLELAFIRWSVVHRGWHEIGGDCPLLLAFLAGWSCRCIGASMPEDVGQFRDSFRVGWREADDQIAIASRQNQRDGELGRVKTADGQSKRLHGQRRASVSPGRGQKQ